MNDYYTPPDAELLDDTKSKSRVAHAISAAASAFVAVLLLVFLYAYLRNADLAQTKFLRILFICSTTAVVVGFLLLHLRKLSIVKATLIGAVLGPGIVIVFSIINRFLMFLT